MYKKYFMSLMIFVFLTLLPTLSLAAPTTPDGQKIELYTYWFKQSDSTWGSDIYAHVIFHEHSPTPFS